MNLPVEVIDAVRDGRCLVFVGSRFTAEAREEAGLTICDGRALAKALGWSRPRLLPGRNPVPITPSVQSAAATQIETLGQAGLASMLMGLVGADGLQPTDAHRFVIEHFKTIFTTTFDTLIEQAAEDAGRALSVVGRGEDIPEASEDTSVLVRLRGSFGDGIVATAEAHERSAWTDEQRRNVRKLLRANVVLFVGYRPDEEEFEVLFEELRQAYRAELPRCHLAVAQGRIDDYQWQRWVWRGLLLFTADPTECMEALKKELSTC